MKKRMLSVFLTLALVMGMIVMPAGAATREMPETCPCGCGAALEEVYWQRWDPNAKTLYSGHYYLDGNYVQDKQFNIVEGDKYVLDLRGYELSTASYSRLFLCYGYLAVLDSVGGSKMSAKTNNDIGGVLLMQTNGTFELYGGTMTVDADNKGCRRGGLISVGVNCTFNMYGGVLVGGSSQGTNSGEGGSIAVPSSSGTVRILGGSVVGGYSPSHGGNIYSIGTVVLKNCTVTGGIADGYGGNIYQKGGSLTVENCVISHGVSNGTAATITGGGNIAAVSSAQVSIKDSQIHNGYAAANGGNLYFGTGTQTLENVEVTAGVCRLAGGNIRIVSNGKTTMEDCTADGDVNCAGTLTLAGATKIGLRNHGLKLGANPLQAKDLTQGAQIFVTAEGLFTDATAKAAYFLPALRTVVTESAEGLVATQAADGEVGGYCPHCYDPENPQKVTWKAFSTTDSRVQACYHDSATDTDPACTNKHIEAGHYYLAQSYTSFSQMYVGAVLDNVAVASSDVVLDLNGCSITAGARLFYVRKGNTGAGIPASAFTLLDSVGGAVISGKGVADQACGLLYNEAANLSIYGGTYIYNAGKAVRNGGIVYANGHTFIHGGVFDASAYDNSGYNGGAIYQYGSSSKSLTVTAGRFVGGYAKTGGTLYIGNNARVQITAGQFAGGSAYSAGGNIQVAGSSSNDEGTLLLSGASITGGHADSYAGNLYITYFTDAQVTDCYIYGGSTDDYGGNVVLGNSNTFTQYENCIIAGGTAKRGGNLYSSGVKSRARLTNCQISAGRATDSQGGNLFVNNGYVEVCGGALVHGSATTNGGNICTNAGNNADGLDNYLNIRKDPQGNAPLIAGGRAGEFGGNMYFSGTMQLVDGVVNNGTATQGADLYMEKGSEQDTLTIGEGVTGNMTMFVNSDLLGSPVHGSPIAGGAATALQADIFLEGDYGMPRLCADNGQLVVAGAAVVTGEESTGYATATVAAAACGENQYVKLYTDAQLTLTRDCTVDLAGYTATVSGDYTLFGMDSSAGSEPGTGKAVWADAPSVKTAETCTSPDGAIYIAVTQAAETTYHLLDMGITSVSIRPSNSGIYYTGKWNCDDALASQLASYGVAVDAYTMPDAGFMEGNTTYWTSFDATQLENGSPKTGVIISGILKESRTNELNDTYGKRPIYSVAYVKLKSGATVVSTGVGYSLYSAMQAIETAAERDPAGCAHNIRPAGVFYRTWKDKGMETWEFERISVDPRCPWQYDVVEQAVQEGKMHYYFMSSELHAYSGGTSEPEKWGDCCLIVFPDGQTMLIDSGVSQYGPILVENLQRMGVEKIDHLVITHPHSDHQNGAFHADNRKGNGVLDLFEIGTVYHRGGYDSKNMEASMLVETVCTERNIPRQILEMGDTLQIGEVSMQVLWPKVGTSEKDTTGVNAGAANNASIVMRFEYKDHTSLFTGDLYVEREADLIELYGTELLDVDLLKVPHHGNCITSNSEAFLAAVSPKIAVATGFELIQSRSAQRFTDVGATLLDDRTYGYIHVSTDGTDEMTYETSRKAPFSEGLNGKRVLFVGDSFLYYGRAVLGNTATSEAARQGDVGYFYQLCKSQGAQVDVVNWTYGGTSLSAIMENHIPKFTDYTYDYVVMSAGRNSAATIAAYEETMDKYIEVFRGANPNVKMFMLVTSGAHNISVKETFPMDVLNNLDKIEAKGIRVVDWGKMVADIIRGQVQVPGATQTYDKFSFVHNKMAEDGYHPNQLTGYIVSMFVYCAITGESAVGLPYDFWNDSTLSSQFDPVAYLDFGYKLGGTNYQEIFNSPADMQGLQILVDQYLKSTDYLNYNFTEVPQN